MNLLETPLRDFVTIGAEAISESFLQNGHIMPMFHAISRKGEAFLVPITHDNKDLVCKVMHEFFVERDVVRYVHMAEAWQVDLSGPRDLAMARMEFAKMGGLSQHPNRVEVIIISAEDHREGQLSMRKRIIRPSDGPVSLGPLEDFGGNQAEGRFVGLLPREGAIQ